MSQTILVVDDEPEFVELLGWVLKKEGFEVEAAHDGLDALNKARSILPDLILLDFMLPELDGTAVCEILRQWPSTASIPILMLTGCATDASKMVAIHAGVNEYLVKPCGAKELVSRINAALKEDSKAELQALDDTTW